MSENSAAKQRLLIVDDSKVIRVTARKILQNHFDTVEALDGEHAWELLSDGSEFALVVSDLTMPKLDGFGLLGRIRTSHEPAINNLPVIIITGANDSEATMERARAAGATDFIGKPFDAVHLLARTQAHASAYTTNVSMRSHAISLEEQAQVDTQTGLANESAFMDRGLQMLSYAIRHNSSLAVAQIEIDHFGALFRKHGKSVTDLALEHTASALLAGIRKEDQAARIGTARFAILFPGMDTSGIRNLAERLAGEIRTRVLRAGSRQLHCTVSIGIAALASGQDSRLDTVLDAAGTSLREAIDAGGDRTVVHAPGALPRDSGWNGIPDHPAAPSVTATAADFRPQPEPAGLTEISILADSRPAGPELEELPEIAAQALTPLDIQDAMEQEDDSLTMAPVQEQEYQLEEEIVITSPYGMFELQHEMPAQDPEATTGQTPGETDAGQADPSAGITAADPSTATPLPETEAGGSDKFAPAPEATPAPPRPGLFRRMVRGLFHG